MFDPSLFEHPNNARSILICFGGISTHAERLHLIEELIKIDEKMRVQEENRNPLIIKG